MNKYIRDGIIGKPLYVTANMMSHGVGCGIPAQPLSMRQGRRSALRYGGLLPFGHRLYAGPG